MTRAAYRDESLLVVEGDVIEALGKLRAESVQTCVTSPPYWGLRDYGTAKWEGGDADCDHSKDRSTGISSSTLGGGKATTNHQHEAAWRSICGKCGARRIDAQLGLEATPDEYVRNMVNVFREVRRVLREDGTLWLNLGDSYTGSGKGAWKNKDGGQKETYIPDPDSPQALLPKVPQGLKAKELVGIPWRVAFALQADGWYLRSDIIWHKPNPMPESVTDRPTKAHEYIFLLAKSDRYFFDLQAIREPAVTAAGTAGTWKGNRDMGLPGGGTRFAKPNLGGSKDGFRQKRDVWTIATQPFKGAHFATFPPALIEPCILAGSRPIDAINEWELINSPTGEVTEDDPTLQIGRAGMNRPRGDAEGTRPITRYEQAAYAEQLRESPNRSAMEAVAGAAFSHYIRTDRSGARPVPEPLLADWLARGWLEPVMVPEAEKADRSTSTVLDPFAGSGTTLMVARQHNRRAIGIELNPEYIPLILERCGVSARPEVTQSAISA